MKIVGIDFTSAPSRRKPLTCAVCELDDRSLRFIHLSSWSTFEGFEAALANVGPWVAGLDFPFGQATRFIQTMPWPGEWIDYVRHSGTFDRRTFRSALDEYKAGRPVGDKEHRRVFDVLASSISPQKLYGVPTGMMFFEGAKRLLSSGVDIPGLVAGDPSRTVFEAYPGVAARSLLGRRSYKTDDRRKQNPLHRAARLELLGALCSEPGRTLYDIDIEAPESLCDDPGADHLDALICAIQAAWAWRHLDACLAELPAEAAREGWIADPTLFGRPRGNG